MKLMILGSSDHIKLRIIAKQFQNLGWKVSVISFINEPIPGIDFHYIKVKRTNKPRRNFRYLLKIPKIRKIITQENPDIIDCHFLTSYGLIGYFTSQKRKYVINLYGTDIYKNATANFIQAILTKIVFRKATHIFSLSDTMTIFVTSKFPNAKRKITNLQYGTDSKLFSIDRQYTDRTYDFLVNRLFVENSNYPVILNAFTQALLVNPHLKMLIFGKGPLKQEIDAYINKNDLKKNITLLDFITHDKIPEILNSAKNYISLTRSDGTPNSLFEAIFCGLYPILSDITQNKEWQKKGLDIRYVDMNSDIVIELKKAMIEIAENPKNESVMIENRNIALQFMDLETNILILENKMRNLALIN